MTVHSIEPNTRETVMNNIHTVSALVEFTIVIRETYN